MKQVFRKYFQLFFRSALLLGVLAGLFFSCGEGVRLFPFPMSEAAKNTHPNLDDGGRIPYQFNVHRFENSQGNFQSKSQRDNQHQYGANGGDLLNDAPFVIAANIRRGDFEPCLGVLKSRLFLSSRASRAPPVS